MDLVRCWDKVKVSLHSTMVCITAGTTDAERVLGQAGGMLFCINNRDSKGLTPLSISLFFFPSAFLKCTDFNSHNHPNGEYSVL